VSSSREKALCWGLLALALLVGAQTTWDQRRRVGQPNPGFAVMENLLVAVGGLEKGGLEPFDLVRAMNGQLLTSGREIQEEARRHPPGTTIHYLVTRRGRLVEADVATQRATLHGFHRFLLEGLAPSLLFLALGAVILWLRPGVPLTRLFLIYCLASFLIMALYNDVHSTYRFTPLFLTAWALSPAVFVHLAAVVPGQRFAWQCSRLLWLPYGLSALLALALQVNVPWRPIAWSYVPPAIGAAYWGLSLALLVLTLGWVSARGQTHLIRHRARVLMVGFALGQLVPVSGTTIEAVFGVTVPHLNEIWRLSLLFPLTVAYAMVRYNLFDVRAVLRAGTVYAVVTGLVIAAYAGAITLLDVAFTSLGAAHSPLVGSAVVALAVVVFLNPVYVRTQATVDRLFFRQRLDVQRSIERLSEVMTTVLDLGRIVEAITQTVEEAFRPARHALLLLGEGQAGFELVAASGVRHAPLPADAPLPTCLRRHRMPVTRERFEEDPDFSEAREPCLAQMEALGADLVVPVLVRDQVTGLLTLGPRRSGAAYTTEDLRLLRLLVNHSAVALENAKAYTALERANIELQSALRRVQILESIRASLSKFVPRRVQELIEQAPEAPELAKREADVSVLFVDIAGYTRLSERFDLEQVNQLVERYFGAFLDEILRHGGDVSETVGDGLMVIFQDPDPGQHARAAVLTAQAVIRRAQQINGELAGITEPIRLHVGVNSGVAAVGATKIEGKAGTRWVYTASGPVTNVAARLAALGEGESVFIGVETRARLGEEFPLEDLGERRLRNVEEPARIFRLAVPAGVEV
jgi:class 3 adenylate cyclase